MYIDFLTLIVPALILGTLALQLWATLRVRKNISFDPEQRRAQLWFVWLVPVLGAAVVLSVLTSEPRDDTPHIQL